ncbi:MAG: hypothetical protein SGPRY_011205 [Prymnesium sp.]
MSRYTANTPAQHGVELGQKQKEIAWDDQSVRIHLESKSEHELGGALVLLRQRIHLGGLMHRHPEHDQIPAHTYRATIPEPCLYELSRRTPPATPRQRLEWCIAIPRGHEAAKLVLCGRVLAARVLPGSVASHTQGLWQGSLRAAALVGGAYISQLDARHALGQTERGRVIKRMCGLL